MRSAAERKRPGTARVAGLIALAIGTLAAAVDAGEYSLARLVEKGRSDLAFQMRASLPTALNNRADQLLASTDGPAAANRAEAAMLARRSLIAAPINPGAVRLYAVTAATQRGARGPRWLEAMTALAYRLSRREIGTQLAMIEIKVAAGDVAGALRHYDQSLRVSTALGDVLFPIMMTASGEVALRPSVRGLVANDPPWLPRLVTWGIAHPNMLASVARLLPFVPASSPALSIDQAPSVIDGLVRQGEVAPADLAYRAYRRAGMARDRATALPPFDWAPVTGDEVGADPTDLPGRFRLYAPAQQGGEVLQRLVRVAPGAYRLAFRVADVAAGGKLRTEISCTGGGDTRNVANVEGPARAQPVAIPFVAGNQCRFVWIRIYAMAGEESFDASLDSFSLSRTGPPRQAG